MVPATPEARLRLMLDLEPQARATPGTQRWRVPTPVADKRPWTGPNPWTVVAWTSLAWMVVLGITVAGFLGALERQDRKLEMSLQRTAPRAPVSP